MSKIGSMVFDLQEQEDAEFEFFGQHFAPPAKTALVSEFEALFAAYDAYQSHYERVTKAQGLRNQPEKFRKIFSGFQVKPVMAELNIWN